MADDKEKYYLVSLVLSLISVGFLLMWGLLTGRSGTTIIFWILFGTLIYFLVWILYIVKRETGYYLLLLANSAMAIALAYVLINYFIATKGINSSIRFAGDLMMLEFFSPFIAICIISIWTIYKSKPFISKEWKKKA
ncbi:MAG: hypothetical protein PHD95_06785 [Candidatus ainarchaeum sp.]|nr:hypothetical protein [Candidatus ainarchaeum sp.]